MQQQTNTGWYVLGGIALLCMIGYNMGPPEKPGLSVLPPLDSSAAPDTAANSEIIITPGK
ncbi:MAG: hypothetical protein BGO69_12650 [Bacteroidetes bacterium 46-16]|nr:MAG: hypothetical protein BGO69_12650 [Bacteroidetes bacterium 46-16]